MKQQVSQLQGSGIIVSLNHPELKIKLKLIRGCGVSASGGASRLQFTLEFVRERVVSVLEQPSLVRADRLEAGV